MNDLISMPRILIVEDNVSHSVALSDSLQKAGYEYVIIASRYGEALTAFENNAIDLIILDIDLGGSKTGIDVAREILSSKEVPIIILTGMEEAEVYRKVKELFLPAAFLIKPFITRNLPHLVDLTWQNFNKDRFSGQAFSEYLFFTVNNSIRKVLKSSVSYIITVKGHHKVEIYESHNKEPLVVNLVMRHVAQYFTDWNFFRLSRSLIVNLNQISQIEDNGIVFEGSTEPLYISMLNRSDLLKKIQLAKGTKASGAG
ncbi:DNA-binding LytR/AlgR family response regulator [Dyadobacter jejuensis]|uniref:DNA-binding LytR/AlgR family response regulator n=1 Tax=Dyadobacter jejuensis TaxID=1082580 RepID=A0A316AKG7_9BACT|nr:response regulator [Dyadobacter jejuensis]PWJ57370.1 DNA-binding LytR/AlgR family response regulator [Dyadobacter jejuensis]